MGSWGILERQSDYGLDLLSAIVATQLKAADFAAFHVADALKTVKADIMEEIRLANRGGSAEDLVLHFSEHFPRSFTHGALLIAECLVDYYRTGELVVTEYVGERYTPVDHHIKGFIVSANDINKMGSTAPTAPRPRPRQPITMYKTFFILLSPTVFFPLRLYDVPESGNRCMEDHLRDQDLFPLPLCLGVHQLTLPLSTEITRSAMCMVDAR